MTEVESIITLARHYCIENYNYWSNKYSNEKSGRAYSDNDYDLFPRYNGLEAILHGIELIINKKYDSVEDCKNELKNIGRYSQTIFTENIKNKIENNAINEERNKFITFIGNISEKDLHNVLPLPYNRKLNKIESKDIYKKLNENWNFDGFSWDHSDNKNEIMFIMEKYLTEDEKNKIIEYIFKYDKIFFTIDEMENDYETEIIKIEPYGFDTIYTNLNFSWIIYSSHEGYIVFGGKLLLDYLKKLFSDKVEKINKYEW
jgi:hypothetical protein